MVSEDSKKEELVDKLTEVLDLINPAVKVFADLLRLQQKMNGLTLRITEAFKEEKGLRLTKDEVKTLGLMLASFHKKAQQR